jgi:hypothetical protein
MTPSAMCSAAVANQFPPTSPGYNTKEFQQKKQEAMAACIKAYEEQAKSGQAVRALPPSVAGAAVVTPVLAPAAVPRETAPARAPAPGATLVPMFVVPKVLPDVTLACGLAPKLKWPQGGVPGSKYELKATHTAATTLVAAYKIHWAVHPASSVFAPAQGVTPLQAPLASAAPLVVGIVKRQVAATSGPPQSCTAVARAS